MEVPLEQFGKRAYPSTVTRESDGGRTGGSEMFRPAKYIAAENTDIPNDISSITGHY
jgi:hypothetical protein